MNLADNKTHVNPILHIDQWEEAIRSDNNNIENKKIQDKFQFLQLIKT